MTLSEPSPLQDDRFDWEDQGQRVQFSLGGLMVLMALIAAAITAGRWFFAWLEEPLSFLIAWALGAFVGAAIIVTRNHAPHTRLLNILLVVFVVINWGWAPGGNTGYFVGLICGVLMAWRGELAVNWLLHLCGFTLSRPVIQPRQQGMNEGATD